jgi:hypothetical protein
LPSRLDTVASYSPGSIWLVLTQRRIASIAPIAAPSWKSQTPPLNMLTV